MSHVVYASVYVSEMFFCDGVSLSGRLHMGDSGVCVNHRVVRFLKSSHFMGE